MTSPNLSFHPPVIAHRGIRRDAPENTLAAFDRVIDSGCQWVETDVKITQDGVPILMHDEDLERTTNGHGSVATTDWVDIQKLDAGSWFHPAFHGEPIPRLTDALRLILNRNLNINLELKPCPGRARATVMVALIEASKIWPDDHSPPLISSFDIDALMIAAQMHPEWPRGLLLDSWRDDWADVVQTTRTSTLNLNADLLTRERVNQLAQSGLPILAYTVNDVARAKELLHWGVKAIFSDNPKEIILSL